MGLALCEGILVLKGRKATVRENAKICRAAAHVEHPGEFLGQGAWKDVRFFIHAMNDHDSRHEIGNRTEPGSL